MTAIIYREIFVDGDYDLQLTCPAPKILDVGANTGLFALRMKQLYAASRIVCFEPCAENFEHLKALIVVNQLADVMALCKGVGATTRTDTLYLHPRNIGGHSIVPGGVGHEPGDGWKTEKIELVSLADALTEIGGSCDLLKLDCEGAEYEILRSMNINHARQIARIVCEVSTKLYNVQQLRDHLTALGYSLAVRNGLLVASR